MSRKLHKFPFVVIVTGSFIQLGIEDPILKESVRRFKSAEIQADIPQCLFASTDLLCKALHLIFVERISWSLYYELMCVVWLAGQRVQFCFVNTIGNSNGE